MNCTLLMKSNKEGNWRQMASKSIAFVEAHGIVVRDANTHSLQADLFTDQIHQMKSIFLIKVTHEITNATALSFDCIEDAQAFAHAIDTSPINLIKKEVSVNNNSCDEVIPNLADTSVQSYVLHLLFNNDFLNLVDDMRGLLNSMNGRLEGMTSTTSTTTTTTTTTTNENLNINTIHDNGDDEISAAEAQVEVASSPISSTLPPADEELDEDCHGDNSNGNDNSNSNSNRCSQCVGFRIDTTGTTGTNGGGGGGGNDTKIEIN